MDDLFFLNLNLFFLYIDPSTGSMLFAVLLGLVSTLIFGFRSLLIKFKHGFGFSSKNNYDIETKNIIIYSDHKRYDNVFIPIINELEKRCIDTTFYTMSKDDAILNNTYKHIHIEYIENNAKGFAKLNNINSKVCLSTTPSLDVYQWKKSKKCKKYIHIPHEVGGVCEYRMFGIDFYDSILLSGNFQIQQVRELEKNRGLKEKELVIVGSPCMDYLYNKVHDRNAEIPKTKSITVLIAPSWGKYAILSSFGEKLIKSLIDTGYNIVIRPHPQSLSSEKNILDYLMNKFPISNNLTWNFDNSNFDILSKSDIMITDFSGVIFDYALCFHKPIIYKNSQVKLDPYDAYFLSKPIWRYVAYKKLGKELTEDKFDNIKYFIDECIDNYDDSKVQAISDECWKYKGEGAKRTVDYLLSQID